MLGKSHYNISVDSGLWEEAQTLFPHQLSSLINDYIQNLVNSSKKDISSINLKIEKIKLQSDLRLITKLKADIDKRQASIQLIEVEQEKTKQKELEKERDLIRIEKSCYKCGSKAFKSMDGKPICNSCFMGL